MIPRPNEIPGAVDIEVTGEEASLNVSSKKKEMDAIWRTGVVRRVG